MEAVVLLPGHADLVRHYGEDHRDVQKTQPSNLLLERKVRKIEDEKIKVAAIISSVTPRTILSEIAVNLEQNMVGGTSFMRSKPCISQVVRLKGLL